MKLITALVVCCLAGTAIAQDHGHKHGHDHKQGHDHKHGDKDKAKSPSDMNPQEMMDAWMATAAPGPEHKNLDVMIGNWKTTARHWMQPGAEPMLSLGKCKNEWMLGGRYMRSEYAADFMGQPFTGVGIMGFDRARKEYFTFWVDSMSTQPMVDTNGFSATRTGYFMISQNSDRPLARAVPT